MNVKHYPILTALIMTLSYLAFGNGCCWEEPVDVGAAPSPVVATTTMAEQLAPLDLPAPEVMVVECNTFEDGQYWAEAYYPGFTWQELSRLVAVAHYAGSYYPSQGYDYERRAPRLQDGKAIVSCEGAVDYVTFWLLSCAE